MSADHEDLRILPGAVRQLEDKVQLIEDFVANELLVAERKRGAAAFSDIQTQRIDDAIAKALLALLGSDAFAARVAKEVKFLAGAEALRFFVYVGGAFLAGALSVIVGLWLKAH